MTSLVNYELNESVATISLDDGKVNVLGPACRPPSTRPSTAPRKTTPRPSCWRAISGFSAAVSTCRCFSPATRRRHWRCWRAGSSCLCAA